MHWILHLKDRVHLLALDHILGSLGEVGQACMAKLPVAWNNKICFFWEQSHFDILADPHTKRPTSACVGIPRWLRPTCSIEVNYLWVLDQGEQIRSRQAEGGKVKGKTADEKLWRREEQMQWKCEIRIIMINNLMLSFIPRGRQGSLSRWSTSRPGTSPLL